jgi:hypothetical protein
MEPDAGVRTMADVLERSYRSGAGPVLVTGPEFLASKLRLLIGGRIPIDTWDRLDPVRDHSPDAFVLPAADAASLDQPIPKASSCHELSGQWILFGWMEQGVALHEGTGKKLPWVVQ